jgi:Rhs element Vgr protein
MLAEFEQGGEWQNGLYEYRALLVPRLWMLSQSTQNQIFQNQSVIDIVESELKNTNKKGSKPLAEAALAATGLNLSSQIHPLVELGIGSDADYDTFTISSYEDREYVVQYKETDLNFISRLMEHEGIYYYFEHNEICEKLIITDAIATDEISNNNQAVFQSEASGVRYDRPVVYKLKRTQKQIPSSVMVKDFNYRSPSLPMEAMGDVSANGIGFVTEFGAHFKTPEEGVDLANVRAQEHKCRQNVFSGESNIADFSCGHLYSLSQHFRSDYNQSYMLTRVRHQGSQEIESWGNVGSTKYSNQFSCIPALLQFRPQRLAVKPKLFGIMNGIIDSEQDLGRADLDEEGRYKVQMPFDISGVAAGMASRRIRMAQPYGGGGSGMSFPLVKGTEVIWTCIDGDIDRPIITGTVPNPLNPSVTTTANSTSNKIKTSSGITMGFHDGSGTGSSQNTTGGGAGGAVLGSQQQFQSIVPPSEISYSASKETDEAPLIANSLPVQQTLQRQRQMSDDLNLNVTGSNATSMEDYDFTGVGKNFAIVVPDYEEEGNSGDSKDSYFRMGMPSDSEGNLSEKLNFNQAGITMYTDGDYVSVVKGQTYTHHAANSSTISEGTTYSYGMSRKLSYSMSNDFTSTVGISGSAKTGLEVSTNVGVSANLSFGATFNFGVGAAFSFTEDTNVEVSKDKKFDINDRFWAKIDPPGQDVSGSLESIMENKVPRIAAVIAVCSTAFSTAISLTADADAGADGNDEINAAAEVHAAAVYTAGATLSALALAYALTNQSDSDQPLVELDLWKGDSPTTGVPYAKLQAQHESMETNIKLRATKNFDAITNASYIDLINKADVATINIKAASTESSSIDLGGGAAGEGIITLTTGTSTLIMKEDSIEFKCGAVTFTMNEVTGLEIKGNDTAGFKAEDGPIQSKGGTISGKLDTEDLDAKVMTATEKCIFG